MIQRTTKGKMRYVQGFVMGKMNKVVKTGREMMHFTKGQIRKTSIAVVKSGAEHVLAIKCKI